MEVLQIVEKLHSDSILNIQISPATKTIFNLKDQFIWYFLQVGSSQQKMVNIGIAIERKLKE